MVRDSRHRADTLRLADDDPDCLQTVLELAHGIQSENIRGVAGELERLAQQAQSATKAAGAAIAILRGTQMKCIARSGTIAPQLGSSAETTVGLCGECIRTGRTQFCTDTEIDPLVSRIDARSFGANSILYVPLFLGAQAAGVLGVFSDSKSHFTTRDLRILTSIGRAVTRTLHWRPKPDAVMMTAGDEETQGEVAPIAKPRTKTGAVLTFPFAKERKPLRSGWFAALLTVVVLAGAGIGYLAVQWTRGDSPDQTISQSMPVGMPVPGMNPAAPPSGTRTVKTVSAATNTSGTTKVPVTNGSIYLESVRTEVLAGHTVVSLQLTGNAKYQVHTLTKPNRIYVDLENVRLKNGPRSVPPTAGAAVQRFRVGARDNKLRVAMDLTSPCTYAVRAAKDRSTIVVDILSDSLAEQ